MRLFLFAAFVTLIAPSTFVSPAMAGSLEDRCIPAVGTAILRYGIAYGRIIKEGQAQSDITTAYEATQLAFALNCDRPALLRGMDCIIRRVKKRVKNQNSPPRSLAFKRTGRKTKFRVTSCLYDRSGVGPWSSGCSVVPVVSVIAIGRQEEEPGAG